MDLSPEIIFQNYKNKEFDRVTSINYLISLIDNSNNEKIRLKSLKFLKKINNFDNKLYDFIENLFISDSSVKIRYEAAKIINKFYLSNSFTLLIWALNNESNTDCLAIIIKSLIDIDTIESKQSLIREVEKIRNIKQLKVGQMVSSNHFRKQIKDFLKKKKLSELSNEFLGQIIINYKTILSIKNKFYSVYYELKNAKIIKLDLSDVEFEVRGWKAEFKNNIQSISEIPGLNNLKCLESLNLSNNILSDIKGLEKLHNLSHLDFSNNKLDNIEKLYILKVMPSLKHVKLNGNPVILKKNFIEFVNGINFKLETKSLI